MTFNLADDKLLRFGAARVIARPPLDELRASRTLWNQAQPFTGQAGNPLLDPFLATQVDLSFEYYFGPEALFAMAAFYKDVETHIGYTTVPEVIDGDTYQVTQPNNGDGGGIAGTELTFQTPFASEGALRNFGIYTNYAFVDTGVKEFYPSNDPLPIEGYAKHTAVIDLWFQNAGFEARLGWKYHSPFIDHRGLEWLGCALARRGENPGLQHVLAGERHVWHASAAQQSDRRAAAHHA